jgi:hypothetical protein
MITSHIEGYYMKWEQWIIISNDYIPYRGKDYENLDAGSVCKPLRYKIKIQRDIDLVDLQGNHTRRREFLRRLCGIFL